MVPKALRLAKRVSGDTYCDLPLAATQRFFPDLNLLAITIAGSRFPTTGEYLTAAARLFGLCTNLYSAMEEVRLSTSFSSEADRIEECLRRIRASDLPVEIIQELETATISQDEMREHTVLNQILSSCLRYVEDFELSTNGLKVQHKPHIHTWGEILQKAETCPSLLVRTPTEVRLNETLEAISAFLAANETDLPQQPELIIDHEDIASHQTREAYLRFLERIDLDPCKVPILVLLREPMPTDELATRTLCQLYPRSGYTICITTALRRASSTIRFLRSNLDSVIARLFAEKFVEAPCGTPITLAQALRVENEIHVQKDLRRCMIETFILRTK